MPARKLKQFLDGFGVKYEVLPHAPTYTAQETAQATHVSGVELAKTVIVRIDGKTVMAVVPATHHVDLDLLRRTASAMEVDLVPEHEFEQLFAECEPGAMPPFGNLYGMDVYVAKALSEDKEIVFNAGSHTEAIRISYADYDRLVSPKVAPISHATAGAY